MIFTGIMMQITLAKFTPLPPVRKKPLSGFADFDIDIETFSFKIKGCLVQYRFIGAPVYCIYLPKLKHPKIKGIKYSPFVFGTQEQYNTFLDKARLVIKDVWPHDKWKEGLYSKFKQGLKAKK